MTLPMGDDGRWLLAYATMTGTETLHWAVRMLGLQDVAALAALAGGATRRDPPLLLPYLSPAGERSPFLDTRVRGSLLGLDLRHTAADVARAVFDGLTLAVLDCVGAAGHPARVALSGGGARSTSWCQDICDALGVPGCCNRTRRKPVRAEPCSSARSRPATSRACTTPGGRRRTTGAPAAAGHVPDRLVRRPLRAPRPRARLAAPDVTPLVTVMTDRRPGCRSRAGPA